MLTAIHVEDPAFKRLIVSFARALRAENKSPRTIETYTEATELFGAFLEAHGLPRAIDAIRCARRGVHRRPTRTPQGVQR